jgi:hypothetical protein
MRRAMPAVSVLLLPGLLLLAACSRPSADPDAAAAPPAAPAKTVLDGQLKALEKAKAVEKQLQDDKDRADKAIEDQGG